MVTTNIVYNQNYIQQVNLYHYYLLDHLKLDLGQSLKEKLSFVQSVTQNAETDYLVAKI